MTILRDGQTIETLDVKAAETTEDRIISGMVGRDLDAPLPGAHPARAGAGAAPALEIRDWTVHHPIDQQRKVVDGVSINVRRGEIVGIAGLMGAGRTELAMSVFGRSYGRYAAGTVLKDGKEIRTQAPSPRRSSTASRTSPRTASTTASTSSTPSTATSRSARWARSPSAVWSTSTRSAQVAERFRKSMNIKAPTGLRAGRASCPAATSRRSSSASGSSPGPDVLILDEPTRGIDVGAKYEIYTVIDQLAAQGKAVVFISSELPELLGMCDRIYTMAAGRLTGEFSRAEATQESLMRQMTKDKEVTR